MIPNQLTDVVAICLRDAGLAGQYAARLPRDDGWSLAAVHPRWVIATRALGFGTVPSGGPLVLEGWPDLVRWRGSAEAGHAALRRALEHRRWADVPGDVAFLHVAEDGSGVASRAPAGRIPLYVHAFPDGIVVSTRLDRLLCLRPEWPWRIDGLVLHNWAGWTGVPPLGRTTIRDVALVPQGHTVQIAPGDPVAPTPRRYWDPRPDRIPRRSDPSEYGERLRALVLRHLDDELDPGGANLLGLSGGVDSSTLAVTAHVLVGRRYQAVSNVPVNPVDRSLEERYLTMVKQVAPPLDHVRYAWTAEEDLRVFADGPPVGLPVIHPVLLKLPELQSRMPSRAYFGGEWGDASCGAKVTMPDWLAHAPVTDLLRYHARLPTGEKAIASAIARRLTRRRPLPEQNAAPTGVPASAAPAIRDEYAAWAAGVDRAFYADRRPLARLAQELQMDYWLLQNWEVCSALGLRRVTPFFHREIVELAFSVSPSALLGPRTKQPLRRAFADVVPHDVLFRKKGLWPNEPSPPDAPWPEDLPDELSGVVRDDWFPRPHTALPFGERLALAGYAGYAKQLRALRDEARTTKGTR